MGQLENALLDIDSIYLQAQGGDFAQLKRLVAVTGDKMVMAPTLDEAMTNLFLKQAPLLVFNHSPG
jgi:uncharacterized membrane protein (UPF0182 family)